MIGLSYAGVPLNVPTPEAFAWVADHISTDDLFESARRNWCQGFNAGQDSLGFFANERVELNRLFWPSSCSRWAYGFFVASKARAKAIVELALPNGRLVPQPLFMATRVDTGSPAEHIYSDRGSITATMYCLPPRPLSGLDDLYLLPLVDVRYLLWSKHTGQVVFEDDRDYREENGGTYLYQSADDTLLIDRSNGGTQTDSFPDPAGLANGWSVLVRNTGGQLTLSMAPYALDGQTSVVIPSGKSILVFSDGETYYTGWSWAYHLLSVSGGIDIAHDTIDIDYLYPSAVVRNDYDPLPPWLDTLAWHVGQRIVVGLDGSITAANPPPSVSPDAIDLGTHKIAGGKVIGLWNPSGKAVARCPSAGLSVHPDFSGHTFLGTYTGASGTISPASLAGNLGTAVLKSPVKSSEAISALASQWVSDLCLWQAGAYDVKYTGIQPLEPSGLHGTIIWTYHADECSTRIQYGDYPSLAWEPTGYEEPVESADSSWCATFSAAPSLEACPSDGGHNTGRWCATFSAAPSLEVCPGEGGHDTGRWCATFSATPSLEACFASISSVALTVPSIFTVSGSPVTSGHGTLAVSYSGAQGDILYASSSSALAKLAKDTNATRYLSNTGSSNNPAWAQVALTTGVTGTLPVANGGTNSATALNNNRIIVSSSGAMVEAGAMTNGQLLIGSTGAAPVVAAITAGTGISVTNGAGTITITNTGLSGITLSTSTGTTTDSYATINVITNSSGVPTWGTVKNTHGSFSMELLFSLTDAFGNTDSPTSTVAPGGTVSFNSHVPMGVTPSTTCLPPYTTVSLQVKSTVVGDHATYSLKQSYF